MENTNVPEKPRFEKREMLMLALVFTAVLLHVLFSRNDLSGRAWELPGLGLAVSLLLVQAGFAAYMGKRGSWTVSTWLLLAASALSCPPCVPVAVCGERIDAVVIKRLRYYGFGKCEVVSVD